MDGEGGVDIGRVWEINVIKPLAQNFQITYKINEKSSVLATIKLVTSG